MGSLNKVDLFCVPKTGFENKINFKKKIYVCYFLAYDKL